jgi:hypothetical protein
MKNEHGFGDVFVAGRWQRTRSFSRHYTGIFSGVRLSARGVF